ncbi:MAG: nitroreductase [Thermoproteota archaeon]|jgi:nitroreductase
MNIYDVLENRRSIREYLDKDVSEELLNKILEAGTKSSTSGNMQAYSIIVTRDQKMKEKMFGAHFEQKMLIEAPVFLTFCADFHRMRAWLKASNASMNFDNFMSFMIATIDATLMSQTVALAAESEGLGICYMGTTLASCDQIGEILELPENVIPVVGFALGYSNEKPSRKERLALNSIIHQETYQDQSEEILNIYKSKNKSGMLRYQEIDELRERIKKENIENLAQIYTQLKYTKESHLKYSSNVLNYIKKQNFMNQ